MKLSNRFLLIAATLLIVGCSSGSESGSSDEVIASESAVSGNNNDSGTSGQNNPQPSQGSEPAPDPNTDPDPQSEEAPVASLSASASVVPAGGSVSLDWSSQFADSCTASGGWDGVRAANGQETIGPLQNNQTFSLNCSGTGGSAIVMVSVSVLGSLQISWQAPTENVDGTPIDGLSAYRIHYGTSSGQYDDVVAVNGDASSYTMDLVMGEYFVAMTAVDLDGDESALSNEVIKQSL